MKTENGVQAESRLPRSSQVSQRGAMSPEIRRKKKTRINAIRPLAEEALILDV